jgi:hypothetical protein
MNRDKQQEIAAHVIKTVFLRFRKFPEGSEGNRNAPFHEAFLNAFSQKLKGSVQDVPYFVSLASWLHGLNTTLGQYFFEDVAQILSGGHKKNFTKKENMRLIISNEQGVVVGQIFTDLKNGEKSPDVDAENSLIFSVQSNSTDKDAKDFTADVFIESDDSVVAIELKTVNPNKGEMGGEKQKILEAKAALKNHYPNKKIEYFIGFPFDPTSEEPTGYSFDNFIGNLIDGNRYFDEKEVLIGDQLWNFLSSEEGTMNLILEIINNISTTDFMDRFNMVKNPDNRFSNPDVYDEILEDWYLYREIKIANIVNDLDPIPEEIYRVYKKPIFKNSNGLYDLDRYASLLELLDKK